LNQQTRVRNIKVKSKAVRLMEEPSQLIELTPRESGWGKRVLQLDRLVRDLAVVGCLVLVVVAVRNSSLPEAQSVFGAIQSASGMEWDESLGKLSFVTTLLPQEIQEVWNQTTSAEVLAPLNGEIVHAWSEKEPYLLINGLTQSIHVSDEGEIMSVAHGMDEELILRVRHSDSFETVYGNLAQCYVEPGDYVYSGDVIGKLLSDRPLAFETRVHGRSVEPVLDEHMPGE